MDSTGPSIESLAAELIPAVPRLARELTSHLIESIPELLQNSQDAAFWEESRSSTEANLAQVHRLLQHGVGAEELVVPVEAAEWVRGLVRRGIGLPSLLRAYRLGHAWLWERWSQHLHARITDVEALSVATERVSGFLFVYVDRICDILVETYGTERERATRSAEQLRTDAIRAVLAGEALNDADVTRRLGYDLRRHHVALRLTSTVSATGELERAAADTVQIADLPGHLTANTGIACVDLWVGSMDEIDGDALLRLEEYQPPDELSVAIGMTGQGAAGFRASHEQARQAARIAFLAGPRARPVTSYRSIELVSLLSGDLPRARAFVASRLGALAAPDENAERLRATLLLFLNSGGSTSRAARELFVHQNTVAYRVRRAEELLGRRVTDQPVELTCALLLVDVLGATVLGGEDNS